MAKTTCSLNASAMCIRIQPPDVSIILQALGIFFIFVSDLTSLLAISPDVFQNIPTFGSIICVVNATITNRCGVLRLSG